MIDVLEEREKRTITEVTRRIARIAEIGLDNTALLDSRSGVVEVGAGTFIIDEALLKKIQFIREGEFEERSGAPVLKVVGQVVPVEGTIIPAARVKKTNLTEQDILLDFIGHIEIEDAAPYFKQMCHGAQVRLPMYYYAATAKLSLSDALAIVQSEKTTHPTTKAKIIGRLKKLQAPTGAPTIENYPNEKKILLGEVPYDPKTGLDLKRLVRTIRGLRGAQIKLDLCLKIFGDACKLAHDSNDQKLFDEVRYAASYVDQEVYGRSLFEAQKKKQ